MEETIEILTFCKKVYNIKELSNRIDNAIAYLRGEKEGRKSKAVVELLKQIKDVYEDDDIKAKLDESIKILEV